MQHACDRALWRTSFIDALHLVGAAAVRLPVGEPDPVLRGESAVELYTGGLWATDALELSAAQPHLLIAELFAVGFRWTRNPRYVGRGLWHPELRMGVKISDDGAPLGPAERANLLTIAMDDARGSPAPTLLKVMGIEDVIAEQATSCRAYRVPSEQITTRGEVLIALAHRGIGGPFRAGYLRRRLAYETGGEIAFEAPWPGEGTAHDTALRTMALSCMGAVANTWCVMSGFAFERAPLHVLRRPRVRSSRSIRLSIDETGRGGMRPQTTSRLCIFSQCFDGA